MLHNFSILQAKHIHDYDIERSSIRQSHETTFVRACTSHTQPDLISIRSNIFDDEAIIRKSPVEKFKILFHSSDGGFMSELVFDKIRIKVFINQIKVMLAQPILDNAADNLFVHFCGHLQLLS
jgi:hypothetical protein